ncbi:MAG: class I SAM-dependent methyltransferase [Spirochaetaceae bacterium]|nr:class I SAM-dependent methyltransferase [Spirochaetaceae bacterium]
MNESEWFKNEDFWLTYAPLMFDEGAWAEVPEVIDGIVRLTGIKSGAKVLDLCCGVGRHSLDMALRGYEVTGIDITKSYLDAAKETANAMSVKADFIRADAREFSRPGHFDLCMNLFTSFGYFSTKEMDIEMLSLCAHNLAPGGCLILETIGKEIAVRDFVECEEFTRAGWDVTTEYRVVGPWEGMKNRWILRDGTQCVDYSFILRLYAGTEMIQALKLAGFSEVSILGGFDGRPYDNHARSLVALARK